MLQEGLVVGSRVGLGSSSGSFKQGLGSDFGVRATVGRSSYPHHSQGHITLPMCVLVALLVAGRFQDACELCRKTGQAWRAVSLAGGGPWGPLPVGPAAAAASQGDEQQVRVCVCVVISATVAGRGDGSSGPDGDGGLLQHRDGQEGELEHAAAAPGAAGHGDVGRKRLLLVHVKGRGRGACCT